MGFSLKGVVEGGDNNYISPGINENVTITDIEMVDGENGGASYFLLKMKNGLNEVGEFKLYTSEKALPQTHRKIKHLLTKFYDNTVVEDTDWNEAKLKKALTGKTYRRFKFVGKEIAGKVMEDGTQKSNWFKAEIGLPSFCEITEETSLKFDKNNKYDWARLPMSDSNPVPASVGKMAINDDLPF